MLILAQLFILAIAGLLAVSGAILRDVIDPPFVESEPRDRSIEGLAEKFQATPSPDADRYGALLKARDLVVVP